MMKTHHFSDISANDSWQNHHVLIGRSWSTNQPATSVSRPDADPRAATIRELRVGVVKARAAVRRPGTEGIIIHHARGQIGVLIHRRGVEVIKTCVAV